METANRIWALGRESACVVVYDVGMDGKADLLTSDQIAALPVGTEIMVTWSGGNGPHKYTVDRRNSVTLARPTDFRTGERTPMHLSIDSFLGPSPLTQVRLARAGEETWNPHTIPARIPAI